MLSYAEWNGETRYEKVTDIITNEKIYELYIISLKNSDVIEATDEHPLYVVGKGWRDAKLLTKGQQLYLQNKGQVKIASIKTETRHERVYNLSVENTSTYFIGEEGVLVHNAKKGKGGVICKPKQVKDLKDAKGKGNNIEVDTQKEAEALLEEARPEIPWVDTYVKPKPKVGKEIHPSDGSGIDKPHIKWRDWTKGKSEGAEGHIYFDKPN